MKVLIVGADGSIGTTLAGHLTEAGHEIAGTVYDRPPGLSECFLDLTRSGSFRDLPAGPWDAIIHAAGLVDQSLPGRLIHSANAIGTRRLVAWARRAGCRHFIFLSSISVCGVFTMGQGRRESTPALRILAPLPYMRSKISAEKYVRRSGLPYTILRLAPVLGKGDSYLTPAVVSALREERFFFSGRGDRLVSVLTLGYLNRLIQSLIERGPLNSAYNCADAHVPWRALTAEYAHCLDLPLPDRRRTILSIIPLFRDKPALLLLAFSRFGAHFPDDALRRVLPHVHSGCWEDSVEEAVGAFLSGKKYH